jgi:hypothetical protein
MASLNRSTISLNCSGLGIGVLAIFFAFLKPNIERKELQMRRKKVS